MTNLWKINNMDLWDVYGAYILKGSYNNLLSPPAPRRRLEYAYTDRNGVSVDSVSPLTYEPRRFTIKLAIRGSSATDFRNRYTALFALLAQPGSIALWIRDLGATYTLLYEGVENTKKLTKIDAHAGAVCAEFDVKFLEPVQPVQPAMNPDLIVIENGKMMVVNNPATVFTVEGGKLFLNT